MSTIDWHTLATTSHYQTAVAVKQALQGGDEDSVMKGLEELIDALSRSDRRALESHLMRLMQHIIKWRVQPEHRSPSWAATIRTARRQITRLQRDTPSLNRRVIEAIWDDVLLDAVDEVESEMNQHVPPIALTWEEVFEAEYTLESDEL
ncbi:MAG TPA: DUF29 domain-containing protein [Candidatus Tectomicrobia bacterium]